MNILEELDAIHEYGGEDSYFAGEVADFIRELQSDLARIQEERDALIENARGYCSTCKNRVAGSMIAHLRVNECPHIGNALYKTGKSCEHWEWCGVKGD